MLIVDKFKSAKMRIYCFWLLSLTLFLKYVTTVNIAVIYEIYPRCVILNFSGKNKDEFIYFLLLTTSFIMLNNSIIFGDYILRVRTIFIQLLLQM